MAEFADNNSWQASTMMGPFEPLLGHYPQIFHKDNGDPRSKFWAENKNAATLRDLMKELKVNLTKSQELQTLYHNHHIKECIYRPGESVWLSVKHIKTEQNPKLKHKSLGPFEVIEAFEKKVYRLKLPAKWRIHLVLHVLLLKRSVTRKEAVDQKIANQLKFVEGEQLEQEVDLIMDSMVLAEKAVHDRPPGLYYLIHSKIETHAEDNWELVKGVSYL